MFRGGCLFGRNLMKKKNTEFEAIVTTIILIIMLGLVFATAARARLIREGV